MNPVLVDSNVILDIASSDPVWRPWSEEALAREVARAILIINPIIYAEASVGYALVEELDNALPMTLFRREPLPYDAAFLAGKGFLTYRRRGGHRTAPLPDFYIGTHAAVAGYRLLTRDATRYRTYFPSIPIVTSD
ncbi:MAG: DNA-binding protein [Alphaproteobacteria bacterium]|nr:DNA-binding protein [Alphaproteobacteria bacterium]